MSTNFTFYLSFGQLTVAVIAPVSRGRSWSGMRYDRITRAPVPIPAEPMPATRRPTINIEELDAAPHTTEPISKIARADRKTIFSSPLW